MRKISFCQNNCIYFNLMSCDIISSIHYTHIRCSELLFIVLNFQYIQRNHLINEIIQKHGEHMLSLRIQSVKEKRR
jgi:hypothetical protein